MKIKRRQPFTHKLLKAVAIGGLVIIATSNPYAGLKIIDRIVQRKKWRDFYRSLYVLRRRGLVDVEQNHDGTYSVSVTHVGQKYVARYDLEILEISRPKRWDGVWRICLFDIPAVKKHARWALLGKLKELGFVMMQKSVWVHPFPCREELAVVTHAFEVEPYVQFHEAYDISHEGKLRRDFEKRNGIVLKRG